MAQSCLLTNGRIRSRITRSRLPRRFPPRAADRPRLKSGDGRTHSMKSAFVRLALSLLSLTIPLCAQTVINVNLTGGNVTLYPPFTIDGVSTTSFLLAPGYTITNVSGDDPGNTGIGSQCNNTVGGCTLSQIGSYIVSAFGIIGFPPNGSMVVNGQLIGMWGFPGFIATTF